MPHGEDLRMLGEQLGVGVRRIALDRARSVDEADIGRGSALPKATTGFDDSSRFDMRASRQRRYFAGHADGAFAAGVFGGAGRRVTLRRCRTGCGAVCV